MCVARRNFFEKTPPSAAAKTQKNKKRKGTQKSEKSQPHSNRTNQADSPKKKPHKSTQPHSKKHTPTANNLERKERTFTLRQAQRSKPTKGSTKQKDPKRASSAKRNSEKKGLSQVFFWLLVCVFSCFVLGLALASSLE
jgi:uncharacterized surface anchored protein